MRPCLPCSTGVAPRAATTCWPRASRSLRAAPRSARSSSPAMERSTWQTALRRRWRPVGRRSRGSPRPPLPAKPGARCDASTTGGSSSSRRRRPTASPPRWPAPGSPTARSSWLGRAGPRATPSPSGQPLCAMSAARSSGPPCAPDRDGSARRARDSSRRPAGRGGPTAPPRTPRRSARRPGQTRATGRGVSIGGAGACASAGRTGVGGGCGAVARVASRRSIQAVAFASATRNQK
jgi:hypothetical protein